MPYDIRIRPSAAAFLATIPHKARRRVADKIDSLKKQPRPMGSKKLTDEDGIYRLRAGDYRILYSIDDSVLTVDVLRIGNRRDVYRKR